MCLTLCSRSTGGSGGYSRGGSGYGGKEYRTIEIVLDFLVLRSFVRSRFGLTCLIPCNLCNDQAAVVTEEDHTMIEGVTAEAEEVSTVLAEEKLYFHSRLDGIGLMEYCLLIRLNQYRRRL